MMKGLDWSDILDRAEWTFAQAFFATAGAAGVAFVDVQVWKSAAVAGGASVIALLKNVFMQVREAKKEA